MAEQSENAWMRNHKHLKRMILKVHKQVLGWVEHQVDSLIPFHTMTFLGTPQGSRNEVFWGKAMGSVNTPRNMFGRSTFPPGLIAHEMFQDIANSSEWLAVAFASTPNNKLDN